jgi:hypothetical protein
MRRQMNRSAVILIRQIRNRASVLRYGGGSVTINDLISVNGGDD